MLRSKELASVKRPFYQGLMQSITIEEKLKLFEVMGYRPHAGQMEFHTSRARFKSLICGRRWGKSKAMAAEHVVCAALGGWSWCLGPNYELGSVVFEECVNLVTGNAMGSLLAGEPRMGSGRQVVAFRSGGAIFGKSSHKPRSLLGRGLDQVGFDEGATEPNGEIYYQYIRPVLIDHEGSFVITTTPRGDNWVKDFYDLGVQKEPGYASWQMPTSSNPLITAAEMADLVKGYPEHLLTQEIYAEFLDAVGAIFRGYREVSVIDNEEAERLRASGSQFCIGVDLGRHQDFTVVSVIDAYTGDEVFLDRINSMDWILIEDWIASRCKRFRGAPVLVDSTGVGDRSFRALEESITDQPLDPFIFNNLRKVNLINQLAIAIANQDVRFVGKDYENSDGFAIGAVGMGELSSYQYEKTPGGKITMNAPPGKHDDIVIARALAFECAMRYGGRVSRSTAIEPIGKATDLIVEKLGHRERPGSPVTERKDRIKLKDSFGRIGCPGKFRR